MSHNYRRENSSPIHNKRSKKFQSSFSDDSLCFSELGDSTRSLLSPLYGSDNENLSEGPLSDGEDAREAKARAQGTFSKSRKHNSSKGKDRRFTRQDKARTKSHGSYVCDSSSSKYETTSSSRTLKSKSDDGSLKRVRNANSLHSSSERSITITLRSSSPINFPLEQSSSRNKITWEDWVVKKTIEERSQIEKKLAEKQMLKKEKARLKWEKEEQERLAEVKHREWLEEKIHAEEKEIRLKQRRKQIEQKSEAQRQEMIKEKSKAMFEEWVEKKKRNEYEQKKRMEDEEKKKREVTEQRKRESQQAYKKWLKDSKLKPIPDSNSFFYPNSSYFSYLDNSAQETNTYPVPGYVNPQPWVHPVSKQSKKQSRKKLQNPSPPLLFRDIENRQKSSKKEQKRMK